MGTIAALSLQEEEIRKYRPPSVLSKKCTFLFLLIFLIKAFLNNNMRECCKKGQKIFFALNHRGAKVSKLVNLIQGVSKSYLHVSFLIHFVLHPPSTPL